MITRNRNNEVETARNYNISRHLRVNGFFAFYNFVGVAKMRMTHNGVCVRDSSTPRFATLTTCPFFQWSIRNTVVRGVSLIDFAHSSISANSCCRATVGLRDLIHFRLRYGWKGSTAIDIPPYSFRRLKNTLFNQTMFSQDISEIIPISINDISLARNGQFYLTSSIDAEAIF